MDCKKLKINLKISLFQKAALMIALIPISIFPQNWSLIWSDEFSGTEINSSNWTHETGGHGWGNNELQYYTDRAVNSFIEDGSLVIQALEENYGGNAYTSARLKTAGHFSVRYGKIEARIKLPFGQGIWPAFWMLGDNFQTAGWPSCGEIDIMEMIGGGDGRDNVSYGTAHWEQGGSHASYGGNYTLQNGIFADDYHLFSIEWTPQYIKWFVDGSQFVVIDISPQNLNAFQYSYFIILNMAVGGNWPGNPDGTTTFPQKMYVDYVRVYQDIDSVPQITLISPLNNSVVDPFSDVNISAEVVYDGQLDHVEFYQGGMLIGQTETAPYEMTWHNIYPGCYRISAKAVTLDGYSGVTEIAELKSGNDCVMAPYSGNPFEIPGEIEAEDFDLGGPQIAYYDTDPDNNGGFYRADEQVDIQLCEDDNEGYNIGWITAGEWLKYSVTVTKEALYDLEFRVASPNSSGKFHVEIDGVNVTGSVNVPFTGEWQTWTTAAVPGIDLEMGDHEMKIVIESGDFNLNRIDIYEPGTEPSINLLYPNGGETIGIGMIEEILWESLKVKNLVIGLSTDGGDNWDFVTRKTPASFGVFRWNVPEVYSDNCLIMLVDKDNSTLKAVSENPFTITIVEGVEIEENVKDFRLYQNYPNPFNPDTKIEFDVPEDSYVQLEVFNYLGELVDIIADDIYTRGSYSIDFDGSDLPSGVYFYRLNSNDFFVSKRMMLLK